MVVPPAEPWPPDPDVPAGAAPPFWAWQTGEPMTRTMAAMIPATLRDILDHKHREVERSKGEVSIAEMEAMVAQADPPRNFFAAVTRHPDARHMSIIAEVKRRSPSAGLIREAYDGPGFAPENIARQYALAGASAISCLTDENFFGGHLSYIQRIRDVVALPVLRKDFIVDPWQIWESRAAGADAILLIAECLTESQISDMLILAQRLGMTTLLECHDTENLLRVRPYVGFPHPGYCLLGINNRDLATMKVDLNHTLRHVGLVDDVGVLVAESGIKEPEDLARLRSAGVRAALVGESLMRAEDPGAALRALLGR